MWRLKYKCRDCGQNIEIDEELIGKEVTCPSCQKQIVVPRFPIPPNPYHDPIMDMVDSVRSVEWKFPVLPQVIQTVVLAFVVLIVSVLYVTVGVASQIGGTFLNLIRDARRQMATDSTVLSKSAYAIAIGIYALLYLPCWVITFPFWFIGYLWQNAMLRFLFMAIFIMSIAWWIMHSYGFSIHDIMEAIKAWLERQNAPTHRSLSM